MDNAVKELMFGCNEIVDCNLTEGTGGNISARIIGTDEFLITPTSMDYKKITEEDLVRVNLKGEILTTKRKPSIEVSMHRLIFEKRPDVKAIVHTHSTYSIAAASCKNISFIPPFDIEMMAYLGGRLEVAPFAPPGTIELANEAVKHLGKKAGVLLKNHGAIGVGRTMEEAISICKIIEKCCKIMFLAQLQGGLVELPENMIKEMEINSLKKRGVVY